MRRFCWVVVLAVAAAWSLPSILPAQDTSSPFSGKKVIGFEPSKNDKVQTARRLMSSQRFQDAANILETLYDSDPTNDQILNLLRICYDQSKQYEKAELLARRVLEKQPDNFGQRIYLAELLVRMSRLPEALAEYDQAQTSFSQFGPIEAAGYLRTLIGSLIRCELDSVALARIEQTRIKLGDPTLFAAERGSIYEKRQQYDEAVKEYLPPLTQDSTVDARLAEKRLVALLDFDGSSAQVEQMLKKVADSTASIRVMTLLSDHFLKAGKFDEAFSYSLRQDSLEGHSGLPLVMFVQSCQERHCWSQVIRMTDILIKQHPEAAFVADALLQKARALAELGQPEAAAGVYSQLAEQTDNDQIRGEAVYGLGVLYSEYLHNYDKALIYYDSVITYYPHGQRLVMARKMIPLCKLHLGRLIEARELLGELSQGRMPEDLQEETAYMTGLVEFFDKKFDTAEVIFRKLMVDFPQGFYVNDALSLVFAISQAKDAGSALDEYSQASYALFRGQIDSSRTCLLALADGQPPVLGDLALYELTHLELRRADSTAALGFIDRLDKEQPDSYYRPLGLKLKADILAQSGRDLKQAVDLYRVLLENYSEYPFAREVRDRLRELDSRVPAS
jgi:tetratricopeptide (TPR) repeat protein